MQELSKLKARCQQSRRTSDDFPSIRIRACRNADEQKIFIRTLEKAKELNKAAKDSGADYSFSVRDNAEIWKFEKRDGKWKRDKDWELSEEETTLKTRDGPGN